MSNFKQYESKKNAMTSIESKTTRSQQQWLKNRLQYHQLLETCNQLIKDIFICQKCGKRITDLNWIITKDPQFPNDNTKIHFYHSKRQCNPHFVIKCFYCDKTFRINKKTQKFCSKKCTVKYMNSPILIRHCKTCGQEFKIRLIENKDNNEQRCPQCR